MLLTSAINYYRTNKCTTAQIYVHSAVIRIVLTFEVAESNCIYVVILNLSSPKRRTPMYATFNTSIWTFILLDTQKCTAPHVTFSTDHVRSVPASRILTPLLYLCAAPTQPGSRSWACSIPPPDTVGSSYQPHLNDSTDMRVRVHQRSFSVSRGVTFYCI